MKLSQCYKGTSSKTVKISFLTVLHEIASVGRGKRPTWLVRSDAARKVAPKREAFQCFFIRENLRLCVARNEAEVD